MTTQKFERIEKILGFSENQRYICNHIVREEMLGHRPAKDYNINKLHRGLATDKSASDIPPVPGSSLSRASGIKKSPGVATQCCLYCGMETEVCNFCNQIFDKEELVYR